MPLVNLSNMPHELWVKEQQDKAVELYGNIVDIKFPDIDLSCHEWDIEDLAEENVSKIISFAPSAVLVDGERTLSFLIIKKLQEKGVTCITAWLNVGLIESSFIDGQTLAMPKFDFIGFRKYL